MKIKLINLLLRRSSKKSSMHKFLHILDRLDASDSEITINQTSGLNVYHAKLLLDEQLISGEFVNVVPPHIMHSAITPNGAITLIKRKDEIHSKSLAAKTKNLLYWLSGIVTAGIAQLAVAVIQKWIEKQ